MKAVPQRIVSWLARSALFARARRLAEKNRADWNLSRRLIIADEPNVLYSLLGYRMGKMAGTRERGMSRRKIIRCLRQAGYREVRPISPRLNDRLHPHWIAARK